MKILIVGARGLLGKNIVPGLEDRAAVVPLDIEEWDITDHEAGISVLETHKPDVVVNLAAATDVDNCENCEDSALKVNGEGPGIVARICADRHIPLVHFSTDYVFDGTKATAYTEEDPPHPVSVYGRTKLLGEQLVLENHPSAIIIRIQWLYGKDGTHFITKILSRAREYGAVDVVNDQRGSPTYGKHIALPLFSLIEQGATGIYHVTNSGSCTWFDFARELFRQMALDVEVRPTTQTLFARPAPRPANSVFDCGKLERTTGITMKPWQEALSEYLRDIR